MLSLRGARAGGMLGTGARVGAVVTLGVLLASVVIDGARPTPQWLCDKVMEAIAMDDTMDADEFECKGVRPARSGLKHLASPPKTGSFGGVAAVSIGMRIQRHR